MDLKNKIAALLVVRNEEDYIEYNIEYHLNLGFDYLLITNHCSTDNTNKILEKYSANPKVFINNYADTVFDHGKIANQLLQLALQKFKDINWLFLLDADEFISIPQKTVQDFTKDLDERGIIYATIGWANALFNYKVQQISAIDTNKFYIPWVERSWQEKGHFRKAIVKIHENIEIVVGGHYFKSSNNIDFFGKYKSNPYILTFEEARLLHFEMRNNSQSLFNKWEKLALNENDTSSKEGSPWLERIKLIRSYVNKYKNNTQLLNDEWFSEYRTIWGTVVSPGRLVIEDNLKEWCKKYINKKIKNGVENLCIIRKGNLGDVIMTEPVTRYLKGFAKNIYLATDQTKVRPLLQKTYTDIINYGDIDNYGVKFDAKLKLVYENSSNKLTYIEGFAESAEVELKDKIPQIKENWPRIINYRYVLVAPDTSNFLFKQRNWGIDNFNFLKQKIESNFDIKVVMLEDSHLFHEMISLIRHCEIFIGNDSAPGIIAQCFNLRSFIIFGAIEPKYVIFGSNTTPIYNKYAHENCTHKTRQEEIDCRDTNCMKEFSVDSVFEIISKVL